MTFDRGIWYRKPVLGSLWRPLRGHIVGGQYGNIRQIGQQYPSKKQRVAVSICLGGESGRFGRTWGRGCASGWVGGGGGGVGANQSLLCSNMPRILFFLQLFPIFCGCCA